MGPRDYVGMGSFFPCFDTFGQYVHGDWPGKTRSAQDLVKRRTADEQDLTAHPATPGWNEYGGWSDGPQLKATGHFRTERHGGRWWLVDPTGRLFFSHGLNCVRKPDPTPSNAATNTSRGLRRPGLCAVRHPAARFKGTVRRDVTRVVHFQLGQPVS